MTYYAKKANDEPAYNLTRQWHIFLGPPMIIICLFALASLLTFFKKKHGLAFVFVILQMMFAFFGYGISKLPYLLYPFVKITDAYVNPEMGWTLVIVFILGLLLLLPSLILLLRLFVFDKEYVEGKKS
ncbi:cytochrome D ubiquinol oxidase subunit II [Staphylococcus aureus]|nr:cytochrome D ubiquinol oxidase subunit II [Staphylococcus aureus]